MMDEEGIDKYGDYERYVTPFTILRMRTHAIEMRVRMHGVRMYSLMTDLIEEHCKVMFYDCSSAAGS